MAFTWPWTGFGLSSTGNSRPLGDDFIFTFSTWMCTQILVAPNKSSTEFIMKSDGKLSCASLPSGPPNLVHAPRHGLTITNRRLQHSKTTTTTHKPTHTHPTPLHPGLVTWLTKQPLREELLPKAIDKQTLRAKVGGKLLRLEFKKCLRPIANNYCEGQTHSLKLPEVE